jgi:hypothetical protein
MYAFAIVLFKLAFWDVLTDIPHDFAAFVTYGILALFVAGIWYGSRAKPQQAGGTSDRLDAES